MTASMKLMFQTMDWFQLSFVFHETKRRACETRGSFLGRRDLNVNRTLQERFSCSEVLGWKRVKEVLTQSPPSHNPGSDCRPAFPHLCHDRLHRSLRYFFFPSLHGIRRNQPSQRLEGRERLEVSVMSLTPHRPQAVADK